jgi:hypothetical protein
VIGNERFNGTAAGPPKLEWIMSNSLSKVVGAALLTLAVVGGTATYLNGSLKLGTAKVALDGITTEQSQPQQPLRHAEVIVTEGWAS